MDGFWKAPIGVTHFYSSHLFLCVVAIIHSVETPIIATPRTPLITATGFHLNVWIFTHSCACSVQDDTLVQFVDEYFLADLCALVLLRAPL